MGKVLTGETLQFLNPLFHEKINFEKILSKSLKAGKFKHDTKVQLFHEKRMIRDEFVAEVE